MSKTCTYLKGYILSITISLLLAASLFADDVTITLTGPDDTSVSAIYTASGGTEPYTYSISGGSINAATGQITSLPACTSGQPAKVTITATDSCGKTGTKDVRLPNGVWIYTSKWQCFYSNAIEPQWTGCFVETYEGAKYFQRRYSCFSYLEIGNIMNYPDYPYIYGDTCTGAQNNINVPCPAESPPAGSCNPCAAEGGCHGHGYDGKHNLFYNTYKTEETIYEWRCP